MSRLTNADNNLKHFFLLYLFMFLFVGQLDVDTAEKDKVGLSSIQETIIKL